MTKKKNESDSIITIEIEESKYRMYKVLLGAVLCISNRVMEEEMVSIKEKKDETDPKGRLEEFQTHLKGLAACIGIIIHSSIANQVGALKLTSDLLFPVIIHAFNETLPEKYKSVEVECTNQDTGKVETITVDKIIKNCMKGFKLKEPVSDLLSTLSDKLETEVEKIKSEQKTETKPEKKSEKKTEKKPTKKKTSKKAEE